MYIELVIANNLIANSVILNATAWLSGLKSGLKRLIAPILLATIFGVVFPTVKVSEIACILIKLTCAVVIAFCITGRVRVKRFLITLLIFYGCSFCLAGGVSAVMNISSFLPKRYSTEELTFCIMGGGVVFGYVCRQCTLFIRESSKKSAGIYLLPGANGKTYGIDGFVDTGNEVTYKGRGVSFLPLMLKDKLCIKALADFISVKTATGERIFRVYEIEYISSGGKKLELNAPVVFSEGIREEKIILHRGY